MKVNRGKTDENPQNIFKYVAYFFLNFDQDLSFMNVITNENTFEKKYSYAKGKI
jgi:hypothetical protein